MAFIDICYMYINLFALLPSMYIYGYTKCHSYLLVRVEVDNMTST